MKSLLKAAATLRSHTALPRISAAIPSLRIALPKQMPSIALPKVALSSIALPSVKLPSVALPTLRLQRGTLFKAAAVATVGVGLVGTGVASAMFVGYLAERALERSAQGGAGSIVPALEAAAQTEAAENDAASVAELPSPEPAAEAASAPLMPETDVEPAGLTTSAIASAKAEPEMPVAADGDVSLADKSAANDDEFADRTFTAAIARPNPEPVRIVEPAPEPALPVEAAQPEPDATTQLAALAAGDEAVAAGAEEQPVEAAAAQPEADAETVDAEVETTAAEPTRMGKITEYVNMRAGPENEAKVLTVVPASKEVEVVNCDQWCEIVYDGQRGFVYKSFIQ